MSKTSAAVAAIESPPLDLESQLLTVEEVQRRLKVSLPYVYQLLNSGRLESVMQGNRRFITMRQLSIYILALEKNVAPLPKDRPNNRFRPTSKKADSKRSASKKHRSESRASR